ncbi:MAG TPA: hypothetical protein VFR31_12565 [Thermoanaerobaculia bacterium]|nr:hypothetical protein [Thermoanaerobaculia bacterium]
MPFTIDQPRESLSRHQPQLVSPEPENTAAAVALVLAGTGDEPIQDTGAFATCP